MTDLMPNQVAHDDLTDEQKMNLELLEKNGDDIAKLLSSINSMLKLAGVPLQVDDLPLTTAGHPLDEISPCCCQDGRYVLYCREC